jgi:hypothetical protein
MALQKQIKDIPLGTKGLNLKVDAKILPDGVLAQASNLFFTSEGALNSVPSEANYTLSSGAGVTLPGGTAMSVAKESTYVMAARYGASRNYLGYGSAFGPFANGGTLQASLNASINLPLSPSATVAGTVTNVTCAQLGQSAVAGLGITPNTDIVYLISWQANNPNYDGQPAVYYCIWDATAGSWIRTPAILTSLVRWQPMALPTGHIVTCKPSGGGTAVAFPITGTIWRLIGGGVTETSMGITSTATPTVSATNTYAGYAYAKPYNFADTLCYFSYSLPAAATNNVYLLKATYGTTGVTTVKSGATASVTGNGVVQTIQYDNTTGRLLYLDNVDGAYVYTTAGALVTSATGGSAPTNLRGTNAATSLVSGHSNTGTFYYAYVTPVFDAGSGLTFTQMYFGTSTWASPSFGSAGLGPLSGAYGVQFASQIFFTTFYTPTHPTGTLVAFVWLYINGGFSCIQLTTSLADTLQTQVVGNWAPLAADTSQLTCPPYLWNTYSSTDTLTFPQLKAIGAFVRQGAVSIGSANVSGVPTTQQTQTIQLVNLTWGPTSLAEAPQGTITSGASPQLIGITGMSPLGFSWTPGITVAAGAAGVLNGTYGYAATYEWVDEYGQVHRSAPYFITVTLTNTTGVIHLLNTGSSRFTGNPLVRVYRTTAGGSAYYSLLSMPISQVPTSTAAVDNTTDAQLLTSGNIQLYTQVSNELANYPCPPATIVVTAAAYAAAVSAETPYRIFISKPFRQGLAVEWNFGMYVDVSPGTGAITALAAMDDKLLVFKQNSVFYLYGSSFDITGQNASTSFTTPTQLATFFGAVNQASVVVTDDGCYYQSPRGIELMTRQLVQEYIGFPLDGQVGTIVSACAVPLYGQVRFVDSTMNQQWCYDTVLKRWTTLAVTTSQNYNNADGCFMACAQGTLTNGLPAIYTSSAYTGSWGYWNYEITNGSPKQMQVTTGWIQLQGLQGFSRLYRFALLGTFPGGPVQVTAYYNYDTLLSDTFTWNPGVSSPFTRVRARTSLQKIESVQFVINCNGITSAFKITGISLEYGAMTGVFRLSKSDTAL